MRISISGVHALFDEAPHGTHLIIPLILSGSTAHDRRARASIREVHLDPPKRRPVQTLFYAA